MESDHERERERERESMRAYIYAAALVAILGAHAWNMAAREWE